MHLRSLLTYTHRVTTTLSQVLQQIRTMYVTPSYVHWQLHEETHTQPFYGSLDFVWDNLGEPVPEEIFTHSPIVIINLPLPASSIYYNPRHTHYLHTYLKTKIGVSRWMFLLVPDKIQRAVKQLCVCVTQNDQKMLLKTKYISTKRHKHQTESYWY